MYENGEILDAIGEAVGRSSPTVRRIINKSDGKRPAEPTVSREVNANGGRDAYRAVVGEASVRQRARRPTRHRLGCNDKLRSVVDAGLEEFWSPTQISNTLKLDHPDDPTMRASSETIYEAVYRGLVDTKPRACLGIRRRRRVPRPRRKKSGPGRGIIGNASTAMATLVERMTRYTVLVHLPGSRTMDALNEALEAVFGSMAEPLIRTLTWDQGKEIARHENLAAATGLDVFVCDRSSLWQRKTNENTNGLLRQWWPTSTNFYTPEPGEVCRVKTSINARPRAALELAISRS
jgi:IS30 family transposase